MAQTPLQFKLGTLSKKRGSCCVEMAVFNNLPPGEVANTEIRSKVSQYAQLYQSALRSISRMSTVNSEAVEANYYAIALRNVGAEPMYDILDNAANRVLQNMQTVSELGKMLIQYLQKDWA